MPRNALVATANRAKEKLLPAQLAASIASWEGYGTLDKPAPVMTVGSYWPYTTTLFDYIRRAMPLNAPQSLTADQVYAVSAYLLYLNDIIPEDAILDEKSLPQVRMPNRDGFITEDPRPDVSSKP